MNTTIIQILKRHSDYAALVLASFLSGLGSSLSAIAVFHELARLSADSFQYSVAFALTILPGLFSSQWGTVLLNRYSPARIMIGLELMSSLVVLFALWGAHTGNILLLFTVLPLSSISYGILIPFLNTYTRDRFQDADLLAVAEISNLVLIADFILGSFLGTLLVQTLGSVVFFLFDMSSYWISAAIILHLSRRYPAPFRKAEQRLESKSSFDWKKLSSQQRRAFLFYPTLVAACGPCTAILPGAGEQFGSSISFGALVISTPLLLMLAKTKGQFVGPFFVRHLKLDAVGGIRLLCLSCLSAFLVCYALVFKATSLWSAVGLVIAAHVFSNIVFMLSMVEFKKAFDSQTIGTAAVRQYQLGVIILVISSVGVGFVTKTYGNLAAVVFGGLGLVVASLFSLERQAAS